MVALLDEKTHNRRANSSRLKRFLLGALAIVVVLAIALGVGLGVGLQGSTNSSRSSSSSSGSSSANTSKLVSAPGDDAVLLRGARAMSTEPAQTRTFDFLVEERTGAPDGYEKPMLVVNGIYPGPTIEANEDDRIVVNVTNAMSNATTIHWHGLYQRGTPYFDGTNSVTQCGIPPGASLVYNFTIDGWTGTTWWHSHFNTQLTDGILGALVVHPRANATANSTIAAEDVQGEIVMHLSDLYHRTSPDLLRQYLSTTGMTGQGFVGATQGNEPVPDAGTINGVGQWGNHTTHFSNYTLEPNSAYRLRLIHSGSFAGSVFSVDNHTLEVIEADGTLVEPFNVTSVRIEVAQRYSVILRTGDAGAFWVRHQVAQDQFTYDEPGFQGDQRAILRYGVVDDVVPSDHAASLSAEAFDTSLLVPAQKGDWPEATFSNTISISMQNSASNTWRAFVNSTSWEPMYGTNSLLGGYGNDSDVVVTTDEQLILTVPDANHTQVADIIINNYDDGDHPMHLHGYKHAIVGTGAGLYAGQALNSTNPMRRDTTLVPAYSWLAVRVIADNPGNWMFHCHLIWHHASGLAFQLFTLPDAAAALGYPDVLAEQCKTMQSLQLGGA